jgi:dihydroorotase
MTQSYDLILTGATIVNHDGEGVRDLAITGGRIAAVGNLSAASAGQVIGCMCSRA